MLAADVVSYLRGVQMPGVRHLLQGNLEPARAALRALTPERDPQQWVALHVILGTALRLRAPNLPPGERAEACLEAVRAFECALAGCCENGPSRALRGLEEETARSAALQANDGLAVADGVQMVVEAISVPAAEGVPLLERAVRAFTDAANQADRHGDRRGWMMARSNLGCALTLLGERSQGRGSVQRIEQAIDVLREAACMGASPSGAAEGLLEERAAVCANLSEAFQALAARMMPGERLLHLERSLDWMAAALGTFAPEEYRWLLELDRAAVA